MERSRLSRSWRAVIGAGALSLFVITANPLAAQVVWDNGGADGNWFNASSWGGGALPTAGDNTQINNGATVTIDQAGAVAERVILGMAVDTSGTLNITAGTLTTPRLYAGAAGIGVINQSGGSVAVSTQLWHGGFSGPTGHATYNLSGGSITFTSSAANTRIARNGATGIVNHTGGTWTSNGLFISTLPNVNTGDASPAVYNISGDAVMNLVGRLYVDHTQISPDGAAPRGLDGTFTITGSSATINTRGYLQGEGGKLNFIADAGGITTINVSGEDAVRGEVNLGGSLSVDLSAMSGQPDAIVLINNTGEKLVNGTFANAAEGTVFGNYELRYAYTNNGDGIANDVALVLIPEPGCAAALGLALGALAMRRRRA